MSDNKETKKEEGLHNSFMKYPPIKQYSGPFVDVIVDKNALKKALEGQKANTQFTRKPDGRS